jgi:LmbE family N-acetylglucosaminyl deacetylase
VKRVLVVAHPDDETLFFGGLVIAEPGDWTILCCTIPQRDPVRAYKFFDACDVLGAKARLLPFAEDRPIECDKIDLGPFDQIVTHGAAGEYGHPHHCLVHRSLRQMWQHKRFMVRGSRHELRLTDAQAAQKLKALKCYDHISTADKGVPKWQALLDRYGTDWPLTVERYDIM